MHQIRRTARLAGWLYLPVVLIGPFVLLYVPGKLFVPGDASATASNILASQSLFRASTMLGLVSELFFIASVLALYRLLKEVGPQLAALMVVPILIVAPLAIAGAASEVATLKFLIDPGFLAVYDEPQRNAMVMLLLNFDHAGVLAAELFWGLWLLPLGLLVYRARFLPRLLGVWLLANGIAYVVVSVTGILWPRYHDVLFKIATPFLFGEAALMLWLITFGARERPAAVGAPQVHRG
jgi:hypothetical protein